MSRESQQEQHAAGFRAKLPAVRMQSADPTLVPPNFITRASECISSAFSTAAPAAREWCCARPLHMATSYSERTEPRTFERFTSPVLWKPPPDK